MALAPPEMTTIPLKLRTTAQLEIGLTPLRRTQTQRAHATAER